MSDEWFERAGFADDERSLLETTVTGTTLECTDVAGNVATFELTGWDSLSDPHAFEEPIDETVVGRVSEIRYDLQNVFRIEQLEGGAVPADGAFGDDMLNVSYNDDVSYTLSDGSYYGQFDSDLFIRIRFDGEATIRHRPFGTLSISFPHPTPVTLGFKSTVEVPRTQLTVAPTTEGIATGVSHLCSAHRTIGPDRVHRHFRGYPPLLTTGSTTEIPDDVVAATPETGLELVVPDDLGSIFTAAPLAYFLGTRVRPERGATPVLRGEMGQLEYELTDGDSFGESVRSVLERSFFLDLMVSWSGPDDPGLEASDRLVEAGLELDRFVDEPIETRVTNYLAFPSDVVDPVLPAWPYRMSIEPEPANASVLAHVLHDLAAIDVPSESDDSRSNADASPPSSTADRLRACQGIHGTVGEPRDPNTVRTLPVAYENRLSYLTRDRELVSVVVVGGPSVAAERVEGIAAAYARRDEYVSPIVDSLLEPTRDQLEATLEDGVDFLHYVGSCDGGLACVDGTLTTQAVSSVNVPVVLLDGPGSSDVATRFVERGSVTTVARHGEDGLDSESRIGELFLHGQSIATAVQCGTLEVDRDVETVGDGSYRFISKWRPTPIQALTTNADGDVTCTVVPFPVDPVGTHWMSEHDTGKHLMPSPYTLELEPETLNTHFDINIQPIYYDGKLYMIDEQRQLLYPIA